MIQGNYSRFIPLICRRPKTDQRSGFSDFVDRLRARRNAERGESKPESEPQRRERDASEASDFVAAVLLAGRRRRGEAALAPPPSKPVAMTAEGVLAAARKARGEPV